MIPKLTKSQAGKIGGTNKWEKIPKEKRSAIMKKIAKLPRKKKQSHV